MSHKKTKIKTNTNTEMILEKHIKRNIKTFASIISISFGSFFVFSVLSFL